MAAAEAAGEVAMLPGMVEMEAGVVGASVVTDPGAVVVNVRGFWVAGLIVKTGSGVGDRAMTGGRAVLWNEAAADGMAATMLRVGGKGEPHECENEDCSKN
jgi:hypothetical protein